MSLAAFVLLLSMSTGSSAEPLKYYPLELHELIGEAELCFAGTIVGLEASTFEVEVELWGFGEPRMERVTVERFEDSDRRGKRSRPHALGQRGLYFVRYIDVPGGEGGWRVLGGRVGEMPVLGDRVNVPATFPASVCRADELLGLVPFVEECRRYRAVFPHAPRRRADLGWFEPRLITDEVRAYARSSPLSEFLALETFHGWYRDPDAPSPRAAEVRIDLGSGPLPTAVACLSDGGDGPTQLVCALPATLDWLELDAAGGVRARHDVFREEWGWAASLASLGDLGGDGTSELAVGEPDSDASFHGVVRMLSFDAGGALERERLVTLSDGGFGEVPSKPDRFGNGLAALGDLDGDGTRELAVSAGDRVGWIWIVSLDDEAAVVRAQLVLDGREAVRGPLALAPLGDLDGNGVVDLAAAAPTGGVQLFLLARDGSALARRALPADERRGPGFGGALAAPGDWNGDGTPDLVVGGREDPPRVLCLAKDGGIAAELVLPRPAGLHAKARFGSTLVAQRKDGGARIFAAGFSWMEGGPSGLILRTYPSLWSFEP